MDVISYVPASGPAEVYNIDPIPERTTTIEDGTPRYSQYLSTAARRGGREIQ